MPCSACRADVLPWVIVQVWPYHRLVCGERAHPFRLPIYSQEEADVLLERLREPANKPELRVLQEKMRSAVEAHNANESDLKVGYLRSFALRSNRAERTDSEPPAAEQEKIQSLVGQEGSLTPISEPAPDSQSTANLIRELRLLSWDWYGKAYTTGRDHVVQHFIEHMTAKYD